MTSLWVCLNILVCPKFGKWHQSDSDSTLNYDVKYPIKSTAHRSAKFNRFQDFSAGLCKKFFTNIDLYTLGKRRIEC